MTPFEKWLYSAVDPNRAQTSVGSIPIITTLLFSVCENDTHRFGEGIRLLHIAFEAGQKSAETKTYMGQIGEK